MRPVSVLCRSVEKELTHVEVDSPQPRSDEDLVTEYNAGRADALDVLIDR
jgi:hypothetical protein